MNRFIIFIVDSRHLHESFANVPQMFLSNYPKAERYIHEAAQLGATHFRKHLLVVIDADEDRVIWAAADPNESQIWEAQGIACGREPSPIAYRSMVN